MLNVFYIYGVGSKCCSSICKRWAIYFALCLWRSLELLQKHLKKWRRLTLTRVCQIMYWDDLRLRKRFLRFSQVTKHLLKLSHYSTFWTEKKTKKEVSVLDDTDAKALKKALDEEPNIRWKVAIYKEILIDDWKHTDRLLISDDGHVLRPSCYKKWLSKILQRANLKSVTLHSLRHTNITMQLTSGVDLRTVVARAWHSRTSTTIDIYSHFIKSSDQHASKVIDSLFE